MFLEVNNLYKKYPNGEEEFFAVKEASFSVAQGEVCVILGPSGSGKSTLMNIIGGLEESSAGSVKVDGKEIVGLSSKRLSQYRRNYIGFVFQFYNLIANLTVRENIEVCAHLGDNPLDIDELMEKVGVKSHENKFPAQLSGGQQQRIAIARALVKNPKLLLCDEPTGALDYKTSKEVLKLFETINRTYGTTIMMITHNEMIQQMAHRIIKVKDGQIQEVIQQEHVMPAEAINW